MSAAPPSISDEDLLAFVDGELSGDQRSAVEAFIAASPAAAEQVEIWRQQGKTLRAAYARVEAEPPPASILVPYRKRALPRLLRSCGDRAPTPAGPKNAARKKEQDASRRRPVGRRTLRSRAALVAAFALGAGAALAAAYFAGRLIEPPQEALPQSSAGSSLDGADDLLAQQALSALAGFSSAKADPAAPATSARRRSALIVPNLSSAGYALIGARAPEFQRADRKDDSICLFYARGAEPPFALCIAGKDGGDDAEEAVLSAQSGPRGSVIGWRQAGAIYALAGAAPEPRLRELARRISTEVGAFYAR